MDGDSYNLNRITSLDFETGSHADLKKTGVAKYAEDPTTRIICGAAFVPGAGKVRWDYKGVVPAPLVNWVKNGGTVSAWNATFEWYIWNFVLRKKFPFLPELKMEQLLDTMAVAANNGLPLGLDKAAAALPQLNIRKDKDGHALMLRMSRPRDRKADTWWHEEDPAKLTRLLDYCDQDVDVERAILGTLDRMSKNERRIWELDFKIGHRGMRFDEDLADQMEAIAKREAQRLDKDIEARTGGAVPNTRAVGKLLAWAQTIEPKITSLAKDQLARWIGKLEKTAKPGDTALWVLHDVLQIRQEAAKSSIAKITAMRNYACADGRMRFLTQYYGAFRTGRWAGRGPQLQNYPRSVVKDQEALVQYIMDGGDEVGFELFFGVNALAALASALRGCITVAKGKKFAALDFSQIEARVLPWLAGDFRKLQVFKDGRDVYVIAAAGIYKITPGLVSGDQRQVGKVSELALGFGGGQGAFQAMAKNYGLEVPDHEAEEIKVAWREANPMICELWYRLNDAAIEAIKKPGAIVNAGAHISFSFEPKNGHLRMRLPSGRNLVYREAELGVGKFGNECVTYMGLNQYTQKWEREDTYGGKLAENATQATARDVMASAMLRVEDRYPLDIIGSVHDEALFELSGKHWQAEYLGANTCFHTVPAWATGLPVDADGYTGLRFKKG